MSAAAVAGDSSVTVAEITAASGIAVVLIGTIGGPIVHDWLQRRRRPPIDHRDERINEQAEFIEHLRAELVESRSEVADLETELRRMRRSRRA